MLVSDILFRAAAETPDRPAVWFEDHWRTFREIATSALGFAAWLRANGIQPGDRVALLLDNSIDYVTAHFGALAAGAVEVSLNTDLSADDLRRLLLDCEAAALVASAKHLGRREKFLDGLPDLRILVTDRPRGVSPPAGSVRIESSLAEMGTMAGLQTQLPGRSDVDLASIVYTSGSTGRPKGVMLSHRNLSSNTRSIVDYLQLTPADRTLVILPFHYIYGRSLLYTQFLSGGSLVIDNRFAFPKVVLDTMEREQVTCLAGVPSTFSILLRKTDVARRRFPALRLVTQAGGPMVPALQREVVATFAPARLYVMYGSTEAAPRLTYLHPDLLPTKWGSIGRAIPNVEVLIADENGNRRPPGVPGEVVARGPNIMLGYWKDPKGTAEVLRHSFYFTGDLGYEDQDGCIFLTGRARDIIKVGGNRVSAGEIEERILDLEGVLEVAVVGVPDDILGEAVKAFVVATSPTVDEATVRHHLRHLPAYKQPKFVEFAERLPKNQAGKILKEALRTGGAPDPGAPARPTDAVAPT